MFCLCLCFFCGWILCVWFCSGFAPGSIFFVVLGVIFFILINREIYRCCFVFCGVMFFGVGTSVFAKKYGIEEKSYI